MKKKWRANDQAVTAISLSKELLDQIDARARAMNLNRSNYIRYAISRELGLFEENRKQISQRQ